MPSRLLVKLKRDRTDSKHPMVGQLKPYNINYKSLRSNFKIDGQTFKLLPKKDRLNRDSIDNNPNRLTIERVDTKPSQSQG